MSIKGNFFTTNNSERSALDTVRDTLRVDQDGNVSFKSRIGRGSGTPVAIPGANFDEFVSMMQEVARSREDVAERERTAVPSSDSDEATVSDTDTE